MSARESGYWGSMLGEPSPQRPSFSVLGFMATLKAARDFGLATEAANATALRFDPLTFHKSDLVDALTAALVEGSPRSRRSTTRTTSSG